MRNNLIFLFLFSSVIALAQEDNSSSGIPPQVAGVLNLPKQFFFFDITQNGWLNKPEEVKTKFISGGLNVNFLYQFNIIGSRLAIAPGLSYSVSSVKSNSIFDYEYSDDYSEVIYTDLKLFTDSADAKSKLSVSYMEVPVEIHIHLKPNERGRSFLIAPGFRAGVRVGDFWKVKHNQQYIPGYDKVKFYNIENISQFRYGLSLRLMYYKFGLFGYYQLNHLFEKDKGPAITPFSIGVTVSPF